jgi:hypothetical protein
MFNDAASNSYCTRRMMNCEGCGKSGRRLIELLFRILLGGTEEGHDEESQDIQFPCRGMNTPPQVGSIIGRVSLLGVTSFI